MKLYQFMTFFEEASGSNVAALAEDSVWILLIQLFILAAGLMVGFFLSRLPIVKKSLIPTSLIGGLVILLFKFIPAFDDVINYQIMETITYHCLALGFIAMCLKKGKGNGTKAGFISVIDSGLIIGGSYVVQAIIGVGITVLICALDKNSVLIPASGILLALGFGQGSGQAMNYGLRFESEFGFSGGTTFGLSIATIGFLVAAFVGVIYMNILRRKGKILSESGCVNQNHQISDFVAENEIPDTPSIDKLTISLMFIFIIYGIVYLIMSPFKSVGLVWGFNFLFGSIFASLTRLLMNFLQKKKILKQELLNNYTLNRAGNFFYDMMIIAGCSAIDLSQISSYWWQLIALCLFGTIGTFVYIRFASNEAYKGYENEGFLSMFGMLTGTASSGMILLREIDPKYETPAANNLVLGGIPAIAFAGVLLLLLEYAPLGMKESLITLGVLVFALIVISIAIFRRKIFHKRVKK
ncbi:MAG: sodium/glutamate symporter [Bacillales bacterium]|nr:sodium/glutamate symporter [Bacillales bacterium]